MAVIDTLVVSGAGDVQLFPGTGGVHSCPLKVNLSWLGVFTVVGLTMNAEVPATNESIMVRQFIGSDIGFVVLLAAQLPVARYKAFIPLSVAVLAAAV